jgi:hypothetical protein
MATYYVDKAAGNNANDGLSTGAAKETIQAAVTASANGDIIYVKASATYTEAVSIPANTGRRIIGYTSALNDLGRFVLDGGGTLGVGITISNTSGASIANNMRVANAEIRNFTSHGLSDLNTSGGANNILGYINVWSHDNNGDGFNATDALRSQAFSRCVAEDNGGWGFAGINFAQGCVAIGNTSGGFQMRNGAGNPLGLVYCLAAENGGIGFANVIGATHCTAYDNASHGFAILGRMNPVTACVAQANGGYGFSGIGTGARFLGLGNIAHANTSGATDAGTIEDGLYQELPTARDADFADAAGGDFETADAQVAAGIGLLASPRGTNPYAGYFTPVPSGGGGGTRAWWG